MPDIAECMFCMPQNTGGIICSIYQKAKEEPHFNVFLLYLKTVRQTFSFIPHQMQMQMWTVADRVSA